MKKEIRNAIKEYQCLGCIRGTFPDCFSEDNNGGQGCGNHKAGTYISSIGNIFLGMPKGFNRLGNNESLRPNIYEKFEESDWAYDKFNIPVWKYLKDGHTFVRGMMPRTNSSFIHIFLEDCRDKINCIEITPDVIDQMD